jgi:flagellar protein FlaG
MKPEVIQLNPNELKEQLPQVEVESKKLARPQDIDPAKMKEIVEQARLDQEKLFGDKKTLDPKKIEELVEALNKFLLAFDQRFKFRIHKETHQVWVRILDAETEQVLREIPSKDALRLAAKIQEFVGLLIDQWA